MLRLICVFIIIITRFLLLSDCGYSQSSEKVVITTDRDLYFSGENLWYKISCTKAGTNLPTTLSKVVYLELCNKNKEPVLQFKLFLANGQNNSKIFIPDTLSTGSYFLTGYTNLMKNFGYREFSSKMISVINPFRNNVSAGQGIINSDISENAQEGNVNSLQLSPVKNEFRTRSLVEFEIKNPNGLNNITVSVAKQPLFNKRNFISQNSEKKGSTENYQQTGLKSIPDFLPEPEGEIISGIIRNKADNKPLVNQVITLGFVGKIPSLYLSRTDNSGRFRFVANQFGVREMVIQPFSADTSVNYQIDFDPVFSASRESIDLSGAPIDESSINEISRCIINMQVEALYNSVLKKTPTPVQLLQNYSFYGEPESKVFLEKYIELPTMSEVFKEIVPGVYVKDRKNTSSFKVVGVKGEIKNYFTLVDGIFIKDVNRILAMNPEDIMQIEVINLEYFIQDQELGAIISILTKKGDLSAMNFDNRIFRQEFAGYEYSYAFSSPDYSVDSAYASPVADFRNLLYWNPAIKFDSNGSRSISFYTSDDTGKYLISIEGIESDGKRIRMQVPFSVIN